MGSSEESHSSGWCMEHPSRVDFNSKAKVTENNWFLICCQKLTASHLVKHMYGYLQLCLESDSKCLKSLLNYIVVCTTRARADKSILQTSSDGVTYGDVLASLLSLHVEQQLEGLKDLDDEQINKKLNKLCSKIFFLASGNEDYIPEIVLANTEEATGLDVQFAWLVLRRLSSLGHDFDHLGYTKFIILCKTIKQHRKLVDLSKKAIEKLALEVLTPKGYLKFVKHIHTDVYDILSLCKNNIGWSLYTEIDTDDLYSIIDAVSQASGESRMSASDIQDVVEVGTGQENNIPDDVDFMPQIDDADSTIENETEIEQVDQGILNPANSFNKSGFNRLVDLQSDEAKDLPEENPVESHSVVKEEEPDRKRSKKKKRTKADGNKLPIEPLDMVDETTPAKKKKKKQAKQESDKTSSPSKKKPEIINDNIDEVAKPGGDNSFMFFIDKQPEVAEAEEPSPKKKSKNNGKESKQSNKQSKEVGEELSTLEVEEETDCHSLSVLPPSYVKVGDDEGSYIKLEPFDDEYMKRKAARKEESKPTGAEIYVLDESSETENVVCATPEPGEDCMNVEDSQAASDSLQLIGSSELASTKEQQKHLVNTQVDVDMNTDTVETSSSASIFSDLGSVNSETMNSYILDSNTAINDSLCDRISDAQETGTTSNDNTLRAESPDLEKDDKLSKINSSERSAADDEDIRIVESPKVSKRAKLSASNTKTPEIDRQVRTPKSTSKTKPETDGQIKTPKSTSRPTPETDGQIRTPKSTSKTKPETDGQIKTPKSTSKTTPPNRKRSRILETVYEKGKEKLLDRLVEEHMSKRKVEDDTVSGVANENIVKDNKVVKGEVMETNADCLVIEREDKDITEVVFTPKAKTPKRSTGRKQVQDNGLDKDSEMLTLETGEDLTPKTQKKISDYVQVLITSQEKNKAEVSAQPTRRSARRSVRQSLPLETAQQSKCTKPVVDGSDDDIKIADGKSPEKVTNTRKSVRSAVRKKPEMTSIEEEQNNGNSGVNQPTRRSTRIRPKAKDIQKGAESSAAGDDDIDSVSITGECETAAELSTITELGEQSKPEARRSRCDSTDSDVSSFSICSYTLRTRRSTQKAEKGQETKRRTRHDSTDSNLTNTSSYSLRTRSKKPSK